MAKWKTPRAQFLEIVEGLGFGRVVGDKRPEELKTYGEAVAELRYYIELAEAEGEPLNVEIFGDGYEKPNKATRRAYNRARRLLKQWVVMAPGVKLG